MIVAASIHWNVPPPQALASGVRELLSGVYKELLEADEIHSAAMAAHELVENLVKYSAGGTSSFEIEIRENGDRAFVRLQTRNRAVAEHIRGAQQLVERMGGSADPITVYDELVATSPHRKGSGLGLARIRAEAGMDLVYSAEGGFITIVAERRVNIRRGSS